MRLLAVLLAALLLAAPAGPAGAVDQLPAKKQALLLLRVLAYDRKLPARAGPRLTVLGVYRADGPEPPEQRTAVVDALSEAAGEFLVSGLRVRVVAVPWRGAEDLAARLAEEHAAALYVCAGLAGEAKAISAVARQRGALTAAPAREMAEAGLSVALVTRGDRAGVVVNLAAARAEGASLDAELLALAEVLGQ